MVSVIDGLRQVIGVPNFYIDGVIQYDAVLEYFVASVVVCIVVCSIFKLLGKVFG